MHASKEIGVVQTHHIHHDKIKYYIDPSYETDMAKSI